MNLNERAQIARVLHQHPALSALSTGSQERIASTATLVRVAHRGEVALPKDAFAIVGFGLVKTTMTVGRYDFIASITGPGETIELYEALETVRHPDARPNRPTRHTVLTESATVVFVRPVAVLLELEGLNAVPKGAALSFALSIGAQTNHLRERLISMTYGSSDSRIATMLLDLVDHYGDTREDGTSFVPFRLTRSELAALCGVTTETVIRKLSAWSKTGLVTDGSDGFEIRSVAELRTVSGVEALV